MSVRYDIVKNQIVFINDVQVDMAEFRDFLRNWEPIEAGMNVLHSGKESTQFLNLVESILTSREKENNVRILSVIFSGRKYSVKCKMGKPSGYNIIAEPVEEKGKELQSPAEHFEFTVDDNSYQITSSNISYSRVKVFIDTLEKAKS